MGVEAFLYPFLILSVALASVIFAALLRKVLGFKYGFTQFLLVAVAAPSIVLLLSLRGPEMVWESVRFSAALSAITSCSVAALCALIKPTK